VKVTPTIIIDTREQEPLAFANLPAEVGTLTTGDYSVKHLERLVAVERKSLTDLLMCVTGERDRLERELQRLMAYRFRLLVIEADQTMIEQGLEPFGGPDIIRRVVKEKNRPEYVVTDIVRPCKLWRSKVTTQSVLGSIASWSARYSLPIHMAGDHAGAAVYVEKYLYQAAKAIAMETAAVASFSDCVTVGHKRKQAEPDPPMPGEA
jgi:ERCC4-type nuclease